jgi:hypothetical protein
MWTTGRAQRHRAGFTRLMPLSSAVRRQAEAAAGELLVDDVAVAGFGSLFFIDESDVPFESVELDVEESADTFSFAASVFDPPERLSVR